MATEQEISDRRIANYDEMRRRERARMPSESEAREAWASWRARNPPPGPNATPEEKQYWNDIQVNFIAEVGPEPQEVDPAEGGEEDPPDIPELEGNAWVPKEGSVTKTPPPAPVPPAGRNFDFIPSSLASLGGTKPSTGSSVQFPYAPSRPPAPASPSSPPAMTSVAPASKPAPATPPPAVARSAATDRNRKSRSAAPAVPPAVSVPTPNSAPPAAVPAVASTVAPSRFSPFADRDPKSKPATQSPLSPAPQAPSVPVATNPKAAVPPADQQQEETSKLSAPPASAPAPKTVQSSGTNAAGAAPFRGGYEAYLDDAVKASGGRRLSGRDRRTGAFFTEGPMKGMTLDQGTRTMRQKYAAMSDQERQKWEGQANMSDVRSSREMGQMGGGGQQPGGGGAGGGTSGYAGPSLITNTGGGFSAESDVNAFLNSGPAPADPNSASEKAYRKDRFDRNQAVIDGQKSRTQDQFAPSPTLQADLARSRDFGAQRAVARAIPTQQAAVAPALERAPVVQMQQANQKMTADVLAQRQQAPDYSQQPSTRVTGAMPSATTPPSSSIDTGLAAYNPAEDAALMPEPGGEQTGASIAGGQTAGQAAAYAGPNPTPPQQQPAAAAVLTPEEEAKRKRKATISGVFAGAGVG